MRVQHNRFAGPVLLTAAVFAISNTGADSIQTVTESDATIPVVADIQRIRNARVNINKEELTATISYYQQGNTVILLPVWVAGGEAELILGEGATRRVCKIGSDQPLLSEGITDLPRLRVSLRDLLSQEAGRDAVHGKVISELKKSGELAGADNPQIKRPRIQEEKYRATLCTVGVKETPEIELSETVLLPRAVVEEGGIVELGLLPKRFDARRENGAIRLKDTYLRLVGQVWCRREREELRATVSVLSKCLSEVRHLLGSTPDKRENPSVAFLQVGKGGVDMSTTLSRVLSQNASLKVMIREGGRANPDLVFRLAHDVFKQSVSDLKATSLEDRQWVTFFVGNLATLSGTVAEIRSLARSDRKAREQALRGSLKVKEGLRLGVLSATAEESAVLEAADTSLDEIKEFFEGRRPVLTGISFSQRGESGVTAVAEQLISQGTFRTGWVEHYWPYISFPPQKGDKVVHPPSKPPKKEEVIYQMDDCVGTWKGKVRGTWLDLDLKADGTMVMVDLPENNRSISEGRGYVKDGKGYWSVDKKGRLTVTMTHVWVGVFWKKYEIAWIDADRVIKVTNTELALESGDKLRKRN